MQSPPSSPRARTVGDEILQRRFRSKSQEAALSLLRTAAVVKRVMTRAVEPAKLSLEQYNVLRILRGAGPNGLATLSIRDRMVEEGAAITRLVDKLERSGLVRRQRTEPDRRQVICFLTDEGAALLSSLDAAVDAADDFVLASLDGASIDRMIELLDRVRAALADSPTRGLPR
jgi:MarR family transcriptional regulator, organic hydroperoxide resistance regulator